MDNINNNILNELTEEDVKILCKNTDWDIMLNPIKHGKKYAKYATRLGRLDKKSILAQKNLPKIVFELYKKGDKIYFEIIFITAENIKNDLKKMLTEFMGEEFKPQELQAFTVNDYRKLFGEIVKSPYVILDMDLFFLQTRMYEINISDEMRKELKKEWSRWQEIEGFIEELVSNQKKETEKKENELFEAFLKQKEELQNQIAEFKKELDLLKIDIDGKKLEIATLINKNESMCDEEKQQLDVIKSS